MEHNTSEEAAVQSNDSMLMNLYSLFLCPHFPLKSVYVQHMPICAYYQRHHIYRTTICGKKRHTQKCVQICVVLSDREGEREIVIERAPTTHIHSGTTHYQQSGFKIPISKRFSESHSEQSAHDDCEHSIDFRVDANVK